MSINKRDHSSYKTRAGKKERRACPGLNALTTDTRFCRERSKYKKDAVEEWIKFIASCFTTKPEELFFTWIQLSKYLYTDFYLFIKLLEVPTNSKSLLLLLSIDKVPYISCTSLNDSIWISECRVFGKPDNKTDCTGPQTPHDQCWKEHKKEMGQTVPIFLLMEDVQKSKS